MEQSRESKKKGWWVGVVLILLVLSAGWVILAAPFTANWSLAIKARNAMFRQFGGISPNFFYTLRAMKIREGDNGGRYQYKWIGYIREMDYVNEIMVAQDRWGREWRFRFFPQNTTSKSQAELIFNEQIYHLDGTESMSVRYHRIRDGAGVSVVPYFGHGEKVALWWGDERKVGEIESARVRGEVFELKGAGIIPIVRIVREGEG